MKKTVTLALTLALLLVMAGCTTNGGAQTPGAADPSLADANNTQTTANYSDEMKLPHAVDISPEDGADSVEREGDHQGSPYFAHPTSTTWKPPTPSPSSPAFSLSSSPPSGAAA